jgi:uncharacterized RDD family membrane protein YckC
MSDPSAFPPPPPPSPSGDFSPPPPPSGGFAPPPAPAAAGFGAPGVAGPGQPLQLSSSGKRLGAALLDGLLMIVTLWIGWIVWWVILWKKGQSPAKSLLGMRVVMLNEQRPAGMSEMAMRELVGKVLLGVIPLYSFVAALFVPIDDNRQGLWDKIAGTTVVEDPNNVFGL